MIRTIECDLLDFHFVASIHGKLHPDGTTHHRVSFGVDLDLYILETLLLIESLDDVGRSLCHILRKLPSATEIEPFLKFFLLSALDSAECPSGDTRTLDDPDLEESRISRGRQRIDHNGNILEVSLKPKTVHNRGKLLSRHGDFHSFL